MNTESKLPVQRFESRLALELEERHEFVNWVSTSVSIDPAGGVSGSVKTWPNA